MQHASKQTLLIKLLCILLYIRQALASSEPANQQQLHSQQQHGQASHSEFRRCKAANMLEKTVLLNAAMLSLFTWMPVLSPLAGEVRSWLPPWLNID
jgi:hypothetical protein